MDTERQIDRPQNGESRAQREKTWDECALEEKLERLRQQQRGTMRMQQHVIDDLRKRINLLESHHHDANGGVAVSLHMAKHGGNELIGMAAGRDPLA